MLNLTNGLPVRIYAARRRAATRVMAHVSLLEGAGALTRFPDGRFGAVG